MPKKSTRGTRADQGGTRTGSRWQAGDPSPNPAGRPKKSTRADAWENVATALGTGRDKRRGGRVRVDIVSSLTAQALWRGSDIAARAVELVPDEATRRGFALTMPDHEVAEAVVAHLEHLPGPVVIAGGHGLMRTVNTALRFRRAYGGAAIWPVINDSAGGLDQPLNLRRVQRIERLQVYEPRELYPLSRYTDPMHPKWGEPETWLLRPISGNQSTAQVVIHESRLVLVQGKRVSRQDLAGADPGWGDSVFTLALSAINDYESAFGSAAVLMSDFAQAILKLKDLASVVGANPQSAKDRLDFMNMARSTLHALVLDSEDSFERVTTPMTGLPEIMDRMTERLALALDVPVTVLTGRSPAGLNATGEFDAVGMDASVQREQAIAAPIIEAIATLDMLASGGPTGGKVPDSWGVKWLPRRVPSEKEVADTRLVEAQTDAVLVNAQIVSADDIAESHWPEGGDGYHPEIQIDWSRRRAQAAVPSDFGDPTSPDPDVATELDPEDPTEPEGA